MTIQKGEHTHQMPRTMGTYCCWHSGTLDYMCSPPRIFFFQPLGWQRLQVHAFVVLRTIGPMEREEHLTPVWHCQTPYSNWEIWNTHRIFRIITRRLSISTDARLCVQYLYDWPLFPLLVDVDVPICAIHQPESFRTPMNVVDVVAILPFFAP